MVVWCGVVAAAVRVAVTFTATVAAAAVVAVAAGTVMAAAAGVGRLGCRHEVHSRHRTLSVPAWCGEMV